MFNGKTFLKFLRKKEITKKKARKRKKDTNTLEILTNSKNSILKTWFLSFFFFFFGIFFKEPLFKNLHWRCSIHLMTWTESRTIFLGINTLMNSSVKKNILPNLIGKFGLLLWYVLTLVLLICALFFKAY